MASSPSGRIRFECLPHQRRFAELILGPSSTIRHGALIGGGGCGKTRTVVMAGITLCAINTGLPGVITEPTYGMVTDILEPAIAEICDDALDENGEPRPIKYRYRARQHAFELPWWGSKIMCRSGDKPRRLRGPNLAWAAMDEAADQVEEVFTTLQGRVRHPRARLKRILLGGTPRGYNWIWERFAETGGKRRLPSAAMVTAKASDNTFVTDNDPDWIPSMLASYDPELAKQEIDGEFVGIGQHSTYYAFSRHENLTRGLERDPFSPVVIMCDFRHSPLAWLVGQESGLLQEEKTLYVLRELSAGATNTEAACKEIIELYGSPRETEYVVYADASVFTETTHKNYSDFELIRDRLHATPRVNRRNPRPRDRSNAVNGMLRNALNETHLVVDEDGCPNLVRDLEQVRYIPNSFDIDGSKPEISHWANALSFYAVLEHPVIAKAGR